MLNKILPMAMHTPTHPHYNYTHHIHNNNIQSSCRSNNSHSHITLVLCSRPTPNPLPPLVWGEEMSTEVLAWQWKGSCRNTNWEWLWPLPPLVVDTGWSSFRHHQGQGSVSASPWTQTDQKNSSTVPLHKANQKMHQQTLVKFWKEEKIIHSRLQLHCHRQLSLSWNHHHKGVEKVKQTFPLLSCLPQSVCTTTSPAPPHNFSGEP